MQTRERNRATSPRERVGTLAQTDLPPPVPLDSELDVEERLVAALRARDEDVFSDLLDRWYPPMIRVAKSYVRSEADAEEVVQETWLAVLRGIDRFEGRSSLRTWVFRILANRARTHARREARTRPLSEIAPPRAAAGAGGDSAAEWLLQPERTEALGWHGRPLGQEDPHEVLVNAEVRERIEHAIGSLPPRQQEVITLRDLEGWSAREVCDALSLTEANQRVLLHRARLKVRDALFVEA